MLEETLLDYAFMSVYTNELRFLGAFPDREQDGSAALATSYTMRIRRLSMNSESGGETVQRRS